MPAGRKTFWMRSRSWLFVNRDKPNAERSLHSLRSLACYPRGRACALADLFPTLLRGGGSAFLSAVPPERKNGVSTASVCTHAGFARSAGGTRQVRHGDEASLDGTRDGEPVEP